MPSINDEIYKQSMTMPDGPGLDKGNCRIYNIERNKRMSMNGSKYPYNALCSEPVAVEVRYEAVSGNGPGRCGLNDE